MAKRSLLSRYPSYTCFIAPYKICSKHFIIMTNSASYDHLKGGRKGKKVQCEEISSVQWQSSSVYYVQVLFTVPLLL